MIINRHNYEEHFILYWDNELSVSQKQAVENFVKENADLQEEFKLLGETRFNPDNNIQIEEKEFLLNNSFINITNYEEQLLNYMDDEITAGQRKEIEKFASRYPAVQQELTLLQKTKLQPEAEITFPDKSTLYKREEKVRVISMTWFRVAVAAAIILIAGFASFRLVNTNKNGDTPSVAKINNNVNDQPSEKKADPLIGNPANQNPKEGKDNLVKGDEKSTKKQTTDKYINKSSVDKNEIPKNTIAQRENKNNLPEERKNIIDPNETTDIASLPDRKKDDAIVEKTPPDAINADFYNQDVTLNANPTLYIPGPKEKENGGIKEFLRKTTRVFERRTRIQTTTDDNKLLVGAFAVSLK
ncbi:MAG TPA: hypothetical protein VGQ04_01100 [Chitinophagaceae bacterium]|jgi:hypothetical protein|nr:hypothetical protein [Chitinophagaceae bacterium]